MVVDSSAHLGLKVHRVKSRVLKNNAAVSRTPITLDGDALEDLTTFANLGSIVNEQGVTDTNVKVRISRARPAFLQMKSIWASRSLTTNIKIRIFNTTLKPVLLYGGETWKTTAATLIKIQTFINTCLRRILGIQ